MDGTVKDIPSPSKIKINPDIYNYVQPSFDKYCSVLIK